MTSLEDFVDSTSALAKECAVTEFECRSGGCGKTCRTSDEGVNEFMKLCNACCIKLRADIEDRTNEANEEIQSEPGAILELSVEGYEQDYQEQQTPQDPDHSEFLDNLAPQADEQSPSENFDAPYSAEMMTMEDISTSLRLLVQACDKRQSVEINLGLVSVVFTHVVDCIGGRANDKKLFVQDGLPLIYWWDVFTAMLSSGKTSKTFVCPCRIVGTTLVLIFILKTRCNRPHYDCLVYDVDTDKAFVMRQDTKWQSNFQLDPALHDYNVDAMNIAVETWLAVGRWRYDPKRGLRLECKKPQLADTELKELGYAETGTSGVEELPVKRKSVPVEPFNTEVTLVRGAKKRPAPTGISTDTESVANSAAKVRCKRKRKHSKKLDVVEVSSSDADEPFRVELPEVVPLKKQVKVIATAESCAVQQDDGKIALLESKLLALQEENEKLKQKPQKPFAEEKKTLPQHEASIPFSQPGNSLILPHDRKPISSLPQAPNPAFLAETCKKLYLDNIGLRTEVDIFDLEAREQFRARKRAEGRLAQVEASAMFDSLLQINKCL